MLNSFAIEADNFTFTASGEVGDLFDLAKLERNGDRALFTLVMPAPGATEIEWVESYFNSHELFNAHADIRTEHLGSAEMLRLRLMDAINEGWHPEV